MLLADSNVWLALALSKHGFHEVARKWLETQPHSGGLVFCRATQQSFLRLLTTEAILSPFGLPALSNKAAWAVYEGFLGNDRISWVEEPGSLESHWKKLAVRPLASPKLWMDAYLAAFALAGNYEFVTTDKAFKQFKGLNLVLLTRS